MIIILKRDALPDEQIMEYNILDFSTWEDDSTFDAVFRKLIDGLELFYEG